ncbi:hypothetical protein R0648_001257 [Escherichia coli]|nr:hypothetical protein [Escherichia coli]
MSITYDNMDIFTGSHVELSISTNIDAEPSFFDPSFSTVENLASFPTISFSNEIETLEEYNSDVTAKLRGGRKIENTNLSLYRVINDEHQELLNQAVLSKQLLRFRVFYVIDTDQNTSGQTGYYCVYDAYVTSAKTKGSDTSAVTVEYRLEPEGSVLLDGVATLGRVIREGDFGIGAGVGVFPGVIDSESLSGNRFVTYKGTASSNPFGADTTMISLQPNEDGGWQLTGSVTGNPRLRVRTIQKDGATGWFKVYTSAEKPTAADVGAVSLTARVDFGEY